MMNEEIELLDPKLLNRSIYRKKLEYWSKVLATESGWHYPLDIIWILDKIKKLKLPKGSVILDAGAGYGLLQYILASEGYNVLSVDFADRPILFPHKLLFDIDVMSRKKFDHSYISHLKDLPGMKNLLSKVGIYARRMTSWNPFYYLQAYLNKSKYGSITYVEDDFTKLSQINNKSVDLVVSVSAVEHVDKKSDLGKTVMQLKRVLKSKGKMLITTSATEKDFRHTPSQGWCFSEDALKKLFKFNRVKSNYDEYGNVMKSIRKSKYLKENMPSFYYKTENCGMPLGKWDPKYLPVGIIA